MKHVYTLRLSMAALIVWFGLNARAQSPTTVTPSSNCNFARTFTTSDEGFSSPSIYSSGDDVSFFWVPAQGALVESSGLTARSGSLISPTFVNSDAGQTTVGFTYSAPPGTQYRLRIISGQANPPLEILATTANGPIWTALPSTSGSLCLKVMDADLVQGGSIRYEFSFRSSTAGNITFDNFALSAANIPLPVTFMGFVARKNDDGSIKFLWDVADEINVKGYYVETSTNGADFTSIGYVPATGKKAYNLTQSTPLTETRYFRVKNVDIDGKFKYSSIIKIYGKEKTGLIELYPVPANDQVYVQHAKAPAQAMITVIGLDGKMVKQVQPQPNTVQTLIHLDGVSKGVYMVRFDDGEGNVISSKLIKN